ncbi:MAG: prepilin-type N-terminal cleavage/methylation domain-containing protein [Gammaproteobacteria bacterium]|nr:prepilin-type N-terminal cleavage/methylation domain-containing protein [Gammaproteobacteria bacterium]
MTNIQKGFTFIELVISIGLASVVAISSMSLFFSQNSAINSDEIRTKNIALNENIFTDINRLFRHAISESIQLQYGTGQRNDDSPEIIDDMITIDLSIPGGFPIWPNDKPPFEKNWVRIQWQNSATSITPYALSISTAPSKTGLSTAALQPINSGENDVIISNIDIWPLDTSGQPLGNPQAKAEGGYRLQINTRTKKTENGYQNPQLLPSDPYAQYRTHTTSGIVSPRN